MGRERPWDELQLTFLRLPGTAAALERLDQKGGWRTLFDPSSEEWNWTSLAQKAQLIEQFAAAGFGYSRLLAAFAMHCEERGRIDLLQMSVQAIDLIVRQAGHGRPAEQGGQAEQTAETPTESVSYEPISDN